MTGAHPTTGVLLQAAVHPTAEAAPHLAVQATVPVPQEAATAEAVHPAVEAATAEAVREDEDKRLKLKDYNYEEDSNNRSIGNNCIWSACTDSI